MSAGRIEAQPWRNVPPYRAVVLHRATCSCGWEGTWWYYRDNAAKEKAAHAALHRLDR